MMVPKHPDVKPYLITRKLDPENQETPIHFIEQELIQTPLFYRRNHFSYPKLTYSNYFLSINGLVSTPLLLSMQTIQQLPSKTVEMVLECSGNKRSLFEPKVFGEQWEKGAISQGVWTGVSLSTLLGLSGISQDAKEVVVEGYDQGKRTDSDESFYYSRSLPVEKALHPDTIIAYEYNKKPLSFKHGFPFRLIVPQWYGMASVKWIKQISVIGSYFTGPFQRIDYLYYPNQENDDGAQPVTTMNVNSTIHKPLDMAILNTGKHEIKGIAWTGNGSITKVEISMDNGDTWTNANIINQKSSYKWVSWSHEWKATENGIYTIKSKATDSHGQTQPSKPYWNRKGYGYNAIDQIRVRVE
ncbi:sulfite oxidase [Neobacillus niacini]|uniref:sulfite oxidase n=2 Tax=Neobacillus niacini TaxID=86668 RepID=UPI00052F815F|nr:sulfite oxidase [Neobacillus niacini]KGM45626.1 sulfite oxidase [Neobacillus niacini]MEC1525521.1 sulfite oxidase [Neobacillus niacini]